jgi:hypothetical protein
MDTIDSRPVAVEEENSPEAALRRSLAPYVAFFRNWVSVATAFAALVAGSGVLIAGPSFAQAGVPFAKLPLLLLTAAGLNFVISTTAALYLGLVAGFARARKFALGTIGFGFVLYFGNFLEHAGLSLGLLMYFVVPVVAGYWLRRPPAVLDPRVRWIAVLLPVMLLFAYHYLAYPSVPAAVGGGRPKPVRIAWIDRLPLLIPKSGTTYEVFRDEDFIYIVVEPDGHGGPLDRFLRRSFSPKATFVAVPVAQVRYVVYLPWESSFDPLPDLDSGLAVSSIQLSDAGQAGVIVEAAQTTTTAREEAADASEAGAEPACFDGGCVSR